MLTLISRRFHKTFFYLKHFKPYFDPMKPPASLSVTILANGRPGTPKVLVIDSGITRYLVNCGEGTQRIMTEHGSKAGRIQHVFFTQMSWDHISGLLGVALTARAAGVKTLTVHGPPKIEELMQLTRHFADCETTDINKSEILSKPFIDAAFKVQAFILTRDEFADYDGPDSKRTKYSNEACDLQKTTYAYYFQPFQALRKLDKAKCLMLGIPRTIFESPMVKEFLSGRSVTLPNGELITADQVTVPAPQSPNFLILDCPSSEFIPSMMQCEALLDALRSPPEEDNLLPGLSLVVHFVPEGLFESADYQRFVQILNELARKHNTFDLSRLPGSDQQAQDEPMLNRELLEHPLHHLVVDGTGHLPTTLGLYSQSAVLHRYFDEYLYPLPYDLRSSEVKEMWEKISKQTLAPYSPVVRAEPRTQYAIRPWQGFSRPEFVPFDVDYLCNEVFNPLYVMREEAEKEFTMMRTKMVEDGIVTGRRSQPYNDGSMFPEITFLGTGSSSPNKYRNISGILLQTSPEDFIMLDCGEGSLNQLHALFGPSVTEDILRKLRLILVTHMHADHHGGIFSVALARSRLLNSSGEHLLPVLAPPAFARWMTSFTDLFHHGSTVDLFVLTNLYQSPCPPEIRPPLCPLKLDSPKYNQWIGLLNKLNLEVSPVRVPHTGTSWAYVIRVPAGRSSDMIRNRWSIVYSGDTPPCDDLIEAGHECDLLIHEATMIDQHHDLSVRTKHSTLESAIKVGLAMKAKFTLLNHFSQRYGRVPMLDKFIPNVAVAFDLMNFRLDELRRLPYYVPYYKYAFAKHWDLLQMKAEAYSWRNFRKSRSLGDAPRNSEKQNCEEKTTKI